MHSKQIRQLGWVITISGAFALYFPRFTTQGLTYDGTTYAAIARNMAVGIGSFWVPFYTPAKSFWTGREVFDTFYAHPPMMYGLQSLLFRWFGDKWFIENLYGLLILLCLATLVVKLWQVLGGKKTFDWLPVGLLLTFPNFRWAISHNAMEPTVAVFGLLSVLFALKTLHQQKKSGWLVMAGLSIVGAFLTKGPVGLYPLAMPLCYYLATRQSSLFQATTFTSVLLFVVLACFGLLWVYPPAHDFLSHYFNWQISNSLLNRRGESNTDGMLLGRFYIVAGVFFNLLYFIGAILMIGIVLKIKKIPVGITYTPALNFVGLMSLAGSLPIMISPKQEFYYLVSVLPFMALWAAFLGVQWVETLSETFVISDSTFTKVAITSVLIGIGIGIIFRANDITGKTSLQTQYIREFEGKPLPAGAWVAVPTDTMVYRPYLNLYLQRYHRITLTTDIVRTPWLLVYRADFEKDTTIFVYKKMLETPTLMLLKK